MNIKAELPISQYTIGYRPALRTSPVLAGAEFYEGRQGDRPNSKSSPEARKVSDTGQACEE